MTLFNLKALKEGRPYQLKNSPQFLERFIHSDFGQKFFLFELYLHNMECYANFKSNLVPYLGDVQLRDFTSFVSNHVQWRDSFQTINRNEGNSTLYIRDEPRFPRDLMIKHERSLKSPMKTQHLKDLQRTVITTCIHMISKQQQYSLEGSEHRWKDSSPYLRERDPYCFGNFKHALLGVPSYVGCMEACGPLWLGMRFKFPLIWLPVRPYISNYTLTGREHLNVPSISLISTYRVWIQIQIQSNGIFCMGRCNSIVGGPGIVPFLLHLLPPFALSCLIFINQIEAFSSI